MKPVHVCTVHTEQTVVTVQTHVLSADTMQTHVCSVAMILDINLNGYSPVLEDARINGFDFYFKSCQKR